MITLDGRLRKLERRNRALSCALVVVVVANFGAVGALWMRPPETPLAAIPESPERTLASAQPAQSAPAPAPPAAPSMPDHLVVTAIDLVDEAGLVRARLRIDAETGAGVFESLDDGGTPLAVLGPGSLRLVGGEGRSAATLSAGSLRLDGAADASSFELERDADGRIAMSLADAGGRRAFAIETGETGARLAVFHDGAPGATIERGALTLAGDAGGARIAGGSLELAGADASVGVALGARSWGGHISLANGAGETVARLGAGDTGNGELETFDSAGRRLASIVATADGQGGLFAFNALGNLAMQLAADETGDGVLRVNNRLGQSRFILTTGPRDEASMYTVDVRGRLIPLLGAEAAARKARASAEEASR